MAENEIKATVNIEDLQQKANEYAQKGAEEVIKDFYTGYNSPYKKALENDLKNKAIDTAFDLPDIIVTLNQKFSEKIDQIANTAVAKSFLPMVHQFLIREEAEIKFSDILEKFIASTDFEYRQKYQKEDLEDIEEFTVTKLEERYDSFFEYQISNGRIGYELRFFKNSNEKTTIMSIPRTLDETGKYYGRVEKEQTMKISLDGGATLELPFVKGILDNVFVSFIARLVIGDNNIIFDVEDFNDDMFPQDEQCHCD